MQQYHQQATPTSNYTEINTTTASSTAAGTMNPFIFYITQNTSGGAANGSNHQSATEYTRAMSSRVADKILEFSSRKSGVSVELSGLGSAIELCFKVAQEVQSKF